MLVLFLLIGLPIAGYYLFTGIFDVIVGPNKKEDYHFKPDTHIHHHYNTHNHLHIDKKDLTEMIESKKSNS
ncbi:hypothetical protein [Polaribacter aestuariivivens]|uniref:hypothetical protein n=1 Tax=Polaribacter aestuariivivens TaxID=2304626 RepID=UPI003F49A7B8